MGRQGHVVFGGLVNWLIHLFPMIFWRCKRILGIVSLLASMQRPSMVNSPEA